MGFIVICGWVLFFQLFKVCKGFFDDLVFVGCQFQLECCGVLDDLVWLFGVGNDGGDEWVLYILG